MAYKVSFLDNQVCGVDDFNAIIGDIVKKGVVTNDFDATEAYQISRMNTVTGDVVSQGVALGESSLKCERGEGVIYIHPGLGIFGSGAKIKVTEKEVLEVSDVSKVYVYAYHDVINNIAGFRARAAEIEEEIEGELYILPLFKVLEGEEEDLREYAKAEIRVCDTFNTTKKMTWDVWGNEYNGQEIELPVDGDKINFLLFLTSNGCFSLVTENADGTFTVSNSEGGSELAYLYYSSGSNLKRALSNFRRGDNGKLYATVTSGSSTTAHVCTVYASVYEEVSE